MKQTTILRLFGGAILFFNLWLAGEYDIQGVPLLLITIGFAVAFELIIVKPAAKRQAAQPAPPAH